MVLCVDSSPPGDEHVVHFYASEDEFAAVAGSRIGLGLSDGEGAVAIVAPGHRKLLLAAIAESGIDVARSQDEGRLLVVDAVETLHAFMVGGSPQRAPFESAIQPLLARAGSCGRPVRAVGEMVALLWEQGNVVGAAELEDLWNALRDHASFDLLCAYPLAIRDVAESLPVLADVCAAHTQVLGAAPVAGGAERTATFDRSNASARGAREFVSDALREWGYDDAVEDAKLVVTELAANAMQHGRSDYTVALSRHEGQVVLTVGDSGAGGPRVEELTPAGSSGRGMALVEAMSTGWGCLKAPVGKLVWASLPVRARVPA